MPKAGAFVLPPGVELSLDAGVLSIHNAGDIVIEGAPAGALGELRSREGDVTIATDAAVTVRSVLAAGKVTLRGRIEAGSVVGKDVDFDGGFLKVDVVNGGSSIRIAGDKLEAHVLVAPRVEISPAVKGRATAIQSDEEFGPHKLKGGFSLQEFVELVPDGAAMLKKHGVTPPAGAASSDDDAEEDAGPALAAVEKPAGAAPRASVPPAVADAVASIRSAYEDEAPPPVALLGSMVSSGDLPGLKLQINTIYSDLVKYHQQHDPYVPNAVMLGFQQIQMALRTA
jgi:hypothetical protein